jgi:hypothetical protein
MPNQPIFQVLFQQLLREVDDRIARRLDRYQPSLNDFTGTLSASTTSIPASSSKVMQASGNIAAASMVAYIPGSSVMRVADATDNIPAAGFVLSATLDGQNGIAYGNGIVSGLSGLTVGKIQYLSAAGAITETAPTTQGHFAQVVGRAISTTEMIFQPSIPILIA